MLELPPPEFLYFDLGNVLLDFDHQRMFEQVAKVAEISAPTVRQWMEDDGFLNEFETGKHSTRQVYDRFCECTNSQPVFAAWLRAINDIFSLKTEMVPLVTHLHAAGYRMGILSNTNHAHWEFVSDGRFRLINQLFDLYVLSFEVGAMKPDTTIYAAATDRAGVPPEKIFFIDDREENVEGAREAGWQVAWMTTPGAVSEALRTQGVRFNL